MGQLCSCLKETNFDCLEEILGGVEVRAQSTPAKFLHTKLNLLIDVLKQKQSLHTPSKISLFQDCLKAHFKMKPRSRLKNYKLQNWHKKKVFSEHIQLWTWDA